MILINVVRDDEKRVHTLSRTSDGPFLRGGVLNGSLDDACLVSFLFDFAFSKKKTHFSFWVLKLFTFYLTCEWFDFFIIINKTYLTGKIVTFRGTILFFSFFFFFFILDGRNFFFKTRSVFDF